MTIIADNSNIVVLLLFHISPVMADICVLRERIHGEIGKRRSATVKSESKKNYLLQNLPVIHEWDGCHSTATVFVHENCEIIRPIYKSKGDPVLLL